MQRLPTLDEFVGDVWEPRARRRLAPKTRERDAVVYRRHIRRVLGDRPLAEIERARLLVWACPGGR